MPHLNGTLIRQLLIERNRDLAWLEGKTGIPEGTLRNSTRENPQPISLRRVYLVAGALDLKYNEVLVGAKGDDGVPDNPPTQPDKGPKGPPPRDDRQSGGKRGDGAGKGPRRARDRAAA